MEILRVWMGAGVGFVGTGLSASTNCAAAENVSPEGSAFLGSLVRLPSSSRRRRSRHRLLLLCWNVPVCR